MFARRMLASLAAAWVVAAGAPAAATVLSVGVGQTYATLAAAVTAAAANDVIDVYGGLYVNQTAIINKPLTIQGVSGTPVFSATTDIANGKGFLVINASTTIDNIEFTGAHVPDGNGAGIRDQAGDLIVRNSRFVGNQDGILATPLVNGTGTLLIENSIFQGNGIASGPLSGFAHAVYAGRLASLTVKDSDFQGTLIGHDIKSRAASTVVTGNTLDDGVTGTTSYAIDLSNGGRATITGNTITQGVNTDNNAMIAYAAEGLIYANNSLLVDGNAFDNTLPQGSVGVFNHATGVTADVSCNAFNGLATLAIGPAALHDNAIGGPLPGCASIPEPPGWTMLLTACLGLLCLCYRVTQDG
jgi:hypothetical protein